jgi:transposase
VGLPSGGGLTIQSFVGDGLGVSVAVFVGLDVHRAQITFDALDVDSGEVQRGRVQPANRETFRQFLTRFDGQPLVAAVEAMTGWRFIVKELTRVGAEVRLAEPAETSSKRGPRCRAKTDRLDARLMRELLIERRLPEAWIALAHILDLRARVRLRKTLVDQRTEWLQRIHAVLFHHGARTQTGRLGRLEGDHARAQLAGLELPHAAEQQIAAALAIVEHLNALLRPLDLELERDARRLHGCRALMAPYGIGAKVATAIVAELGDPRRFSSSRQAVRCAGLDITVHESDARRRGGHLSRQGSPVLRWAVFEAAQTAARPGSPDHAYYLELKDRLGANRAALTIARKMLRRAHHTLRVLGDDALAPG